MYVQIFDPFGQKLYKLEFWSWTKVPIFGNIDEHVHPNLIAGHFFAVKPS